MNEKILVKTLSTYNRIMLILIGLISNANLRRDGHSILCWVILIMCILLASLHIHPIYYYTLYLKDAHTGETYAITIRCPEYIECNTELFSPFADSINKVFMGIIEFKVSNIEFRAVKYKISIFKPKAKILL